ncbi:MAG: hypothetical protein CMJ81_00120 [Planctomycetaceae bacterium]|nr:hypothetical protein [Planctomycetaceae bacterium]MBP60341.1 hypothetical protein [Planctomycetaceae bacterium]
MQFARCEDGEIPKCHPSIQGFPGCQNVSPPALFRETFGLLAFPRHTGSATLVQGAENLS